MASGPITSWQIEGETKEAVTDCVFLGSKITVDGDYKIKNKKPKNLLLGQKAMTNLDSVWKRKDITLLTKFHIVKAMVFPVVMYGCENWTIKENEWWRIDALGLWCQKRLLRVPWTPRRSIQSILKEINPWIFLGRTDAETESPVLWPPDVKSWLIRKYPNFWKDWRQKEKGSAEDGNVGWHHWLNGHEVEQTLGNSGGQRNLACFSPWTRRVKPNIVTETLQHQIYLAFISISDKLKVVWEQIAIKCLFF